jgi:hypothetical protein
MHMHNTHPLSPLHTHYSLTHTGSDTDASSDVEGVSRHLVELISLIMLPLGMVMCVYALYVFTWRASNIAKKKVRGRAQANACWKFCYPYVLIASAYIGILYHV